MIIMTFDGAINHNNFDHYQKIFTQDRLNPNNCPLRGTFFISHEYCNYNMVQSLAHDGHEIATETISWVAWILYLGCVRIRWCWWGKFFSDSRKAWRTKVTRSGSARWSECVRYWSTSVIFRPAKLSVCEHLTWNLVVTLSIKCSKILDIYMIVV